MLDETPQQSRLPILQGQVGRGFSLFSPDKLDRLSGTLLAANLDNVQTSAEPSCRLGIVKHLDRATLKN
jgi:hypothetical protein